MESFVQNGSAMAKRPSSRRRFLARHSLSIVVAAIWLLWLVLYQTADPQTHIGAFYGNSIADWLVPRLRSSLLHRGRRGARLARREE